jgi:superfamily II DNA or RNA helicase
LLANFPQEQGVAVCSSGNLLVPELSGSASLSLRFSEQEDYSRFRKQFEAWWGQATPFTDKLVQELRGSWAIQTTTPYLLYLFVLYRLVANRLQETEEEAGDDWLEGFPPLTDFQQVAVQQAMTILRQHNGVFIADVVGLGKTYIGTALLKRFVQQGQRATVFCPPSLVPMWEDFNHVYGLGAIVVSTGKLLKENGVNLSEPKYRTTDRQIVLLDESHRFRNRDTDRYRILSQYAEGKRCILLTATPYSLHPRDIYSQIRIFADDELDLGLNPPRLNEFFRDIEEGKTSLVDVLRPLLIRRTRKHIQKHYPNAVTRVRQADGQTIVTPLVFPKREKPEIVRYDVEGVYGEGLYDRIIDKLGRPGYRENGIYQLPAFTPGELSYGRYGLYDYVLPEYANKPPYTDLKGAGYAVRGFIRILLFKRLESSVEAFRTTMQALRTVHERFLVALANGYVPAGDEGQSILYDQNWSDDSDMLDALSALSGRYDTQAFDMTRLERDIRNDCEVLRELASLLQPITADVDGKLETLRDLLTKTVQGRKALIFTQYEATAQYLYNHLSDLPQVAWLSGRHRTSGKSFMETVARFAPAANPIFVRGGTDPIQTLIATDVLSEGLNLQDCSLVINYDLHWNPVRLIQRIGRVDRIGSQAESIQLYNFLPERNVEKVLNLERILNARISEIHSFIGEDNAILHPDEQINDSEMYASYTKAPEADEEDPTSAAVDFTEIEERIRQLQRDEPETMQAVYNLPSGVRTAKRVSPNKAGAFVYLATEDYEQLQLVDSYGQIQSVAIENVLETIECHPSEPALPIPPRHNRRVSETLQRFEEEAARRQTDRRTGPRYTPGQSYALKYLGAVIKATNNEDHRNLLMHLDRALRGRLPEAAQKELRNIRRQGLTDSALEQRLLQLYRDLDLPRYLRQSEEVVGHPKARILCSEALIAD